MSIPPIGVFLPTLSERNAPVPDPVDAAVHAESLGFESAWGLPELIAGREIDGVQLAPGATVPPIVVGGTADAAVRRAEAHDGWFLRPMLPDGVADAAGRVTVPVTANQSVAIVGDPALPSRGEVVQHIVDPGGLYGAPAEVVDQFLLYGEPDEIADRLRAYGNAGATRIVVTFAAGDWHRQAELLAGAADLQQA